MKKPTTTNPVEPGNYTGIMPEFGRVKDVQTHFGIKRGTLYNLLKDGKIKSVLLRIRGKKYGCRLISMDSVRECIRSQMNEQN